MDIVATPAGLEQINILQMWQNRHLLRSGMQLRTLQKSIENLHYLDIPACKYMDPEKKTQSPKWRRVRKGGLCVGV